MVFGGHPVSWTLATIYWTLLITRQYPQGGGKQTRRHCGHSNCSWTRGVTPAGSSCPCTEEEIQNQISLLCEGWWESRTLTTRGRGRALLGELQDIGEDFNHQRGEALLVCLLQSWDIVAHGMKPDGSKAKQLGSLSQNLGNDKGIGKRTETLSLWRWFLSNGRERCSFKEDLVHKRVFTAVNKKNHFTKIVPKSSKVQKAHTTWSPFSPLAWKQLRAGTKQTKQTWKIDHPCCTAHFFFPFFFWIAELSCVWHCSPGLAWSHVGNCSTSGAWLGSAGALGCWEEAWLLLPLPEPGCSLHWAQKNRERTRVTE